MKNKLIPTIGMEVHIELKTNSKMFCGCPADHFAKKPNTQTCPVCLGLPGALPVPNRTAVEWAIKIGLALNCTVNLESEFDRKHYFYPDLPKGYQISQNDKPLNLNGYLQLDSGKKIRLRRVHLEEDTAKMIHKKVAGQDVTLIDFNRSGVALVEVVTEPDVANGEEAKEYLKKLREIIRSLNVSDCDMEKGSMRLEANISLTPDPNQLADYKVEVKNLNSFRFVEQAINYEIQRQSELLAKGEQPDQETRGYDDIHHRTYSQRKKEMLEDYRYVTEPDIPPMVFTKEYIETLRRQLPKLPSQQIAELIEGSHLSLDQAKLLVTNPLNLQYFYQYQKELEPQKLANLIINKKLDLTKTPKVQLKVSTTAVDEKIIDQVIKENADAVAKYKSGKTGVIGFLVGQVMKATKGQVNPQQAQKLLLQAVKVRP